MGRDRWPPLRLEIKDRVVIGWRDSKRAALVRDLIRSLHPRNSIGSIFFVVSVVSRSRFKGRWSMVSEYLNNGARPRAVMIRTGLACAEIPGRSNTVSRDHPAVCKLQIELARWFVLNNCVGIQHPAHRGYFSADFICLAAHLL